MRAGPLPDLAAHLRLQRDAGHLRMELERAGRELSSGKLQDPLRTPGADPARLYAIESAQARARREADGVVVAQGRLDAAQTVLGGLEGLADELGVDLQAAIARGDMTSARLHAAGAEDAFRAAVAGLNTRFGGRTLFAGAAVDGPAMAPAEDILDDVRALVNGAADADDAVAQVEAYFKAPGGGFETNAYAGSTDDAPLATVDGSDAVEISRRADDPEIRMLLKGLALAAAATDAGYSGPADAVPGILEEAAAVTVASREAIVDSRARLGLSEARLQEAGERLTARSSALDLAWNRATTRDPYEAATEFQALEQQLQRVFAVTSRMAQLNLTDFLR
ncbi:MAG: flagellin [Pseudomonadota bacterium]